MNYLISGGTGFIGTALVRSISDEDAQITVLTRSAHPPHAQGRARIRYAAWDGRTQGEWSRLMNETDVVINLTGRNLSSGRWTEKVKQELVSSRIEPVTALVQAMTDAARKPGLFISVSAVGYYGDTGGRDVTEADWPGSDFLARLTEKWEEASARAALLGVRTAIPRMGIVLQKDGGALPKIALPFRFFVGGSIGSGRQWVSWIHMDDLVRALRYPVARPSLSGPYNCTSPQPVTMKELCRAVGRALHRPCWTNAPSFAVRAALGEASQMVLTGQRVLPERLLAEGFQFHYGNVDEALQNIYR